MENYPDEATSFGFHVIRITLQHGKRQASFTYTVYGNSRGASLLPFCFCVDDIAFYNSEELVFQPIAERNDALSLTWQGEGENAPPEEFTIAELNAMVVKSEIVSFTEDDLSAESFETDSDIGIAQKCEAPFRELSAHDKSRQLFLTACRNWWWALKNVLFS